MRKSQIAFVILTVVFFSIFSELLAIRKEAIFDEWAEGYIEKMGEKNALNEKEIDKQAAEYAENELEKTITYLVIEDSLYTTKNLIEMVEYIKNKSHRRIPIIGLLDGYSRIFSTSFFLASMVISYAGSSGEITQFGNDLRSVIQKEGNVENTKDPEWWEEFKKSIEYQDIITRYFQRIDSYEGENVEAYNRKTNGIKNPIDGIFSPERVMLDNCIEDYKVINDRIYSQYIDNYESRNLTRATVDSRTIYGMFLESKYLSNGQIDPYGADLPRVYMAFFSDIIIITVMSIIISFLIIRIYEKGITPLHVGAFVGGLLSAILYRNILFFIWATLGGGWAAYHSDLIKKNEILTIGFKTGILMFFIDYIVILIMALLGFTSIFESKIKSVVPSFSLWTIILSFVILPLLFIFFSIIGSTTGYFVKKTREKRSEEKKEEKEQCV